MPDIEEIQGVEVEATEKKELPGAEDMLTSRQRFLKLCGMGLVGLTLLGVTGCGGGGGEQDDQGGEQNEGQDGGGQNDDADDQNEDDQDDDNQENDQDDDDRDDD